MHIKIHNKIMYKIKKIEENRYKKDMKNKNIEWNIKK